MNTNHARRLPYNSEPRQTSAKRLVLMASTVAFEINKATLKLRRSLHLSPASSPNSSRKAEKKPVTSTKSTSRGSKRNRLLCAELSSFALYPIFGALTPSHFSSPNLLFRNEKKPSTNILELSDITIYHIMLFLDSKSLLNISQSCRKLREICEFNEQCFPKRDVSSHEIVISFNQIKRKTEVRLLKKNRSITDEKFIGSSISCMLPLFCRALTKVTFETSVFLTDWIDEIVILHEKNKLIPLGLLFTGGSLSRGHQRSGADLRSISETDFINFVGRLQPHLQEVQLATSRLFKTTISPPRLLGLISILSNIGILYERPPLRFLFEEISKIVTFWKNDGLSRSCDVYIQRPRDATIEKWKKLGTVETSRVEPYTEEMLVSKVTVKHSFLVHIDLLFHLH